MLYMLYGTLMPLLFVLEGSGVATELGAFNTQITGALKDFTTTNLATILVAALGVSVGLVICWFGYRFIKRAVSKAMKKGQL